MASGSAIFKLGLVAVFVCFAVGGREAEAEPAVSCNRVMSLLTPCVSYVTGGGLQPTCCTGVRSLNSEAQTTVKRQGVCLCLKSVISGFSYNLYNVRMAAGLPAKCGVNLPYKIDPSTDCSTVKK